MAYITINKYGGKYTKQARFLYQEDILKSYPLQVQREPRFDQGVDIICLFKHLGPEHLREYSEHLLKLAEEEMLRYDGNNYFFHAILTVKFGNNLRLERSFTVGKSRNIDTIVWGSPAPLARQGLQQFIEKILEADTSPQVVDRGKKPVKYRVTKLELCVRIGRLKYLGKVKEPEPTAEEPLKVGVDLSSVEQ